MGEKPGVSVPEVIARAAEWDRVYGMGTGPDDYRERAIEASNDVRYLLEVIEYHSRRLHEANIKLNNSPKSVSWDRVRQDWVGPLIIYDAVRPYNSYFSAPVHTMVDFKVIRTPEGTWQLTIMAFDTVVATIVKPSRDLIEIAAREWWERQRR